MRVQSSPTMPGPRHVFVPPVPLSQTSPCAHTAPTPGGNGGIKHACPEPGRLWQVMLVGSQYSVPADESHSSLSGSVGMPEILSMVNAHGPPTGERRWHWKSCLAQYRLA